MFQAEKSLIVNNITFINLIYVKSVMQKLIGMELIVTLAQSSNQIVLNAIKKVQNVLCASLELI